MTVKAHGAQRAKGHASRIRDMETAPPPASTIFYELHPHLRHVEAHCLTGPDLIYDYLMRRGSRTLEQIAQKTGHDNSHCRRLMEAQPRRFRCIKGQWEAVPQDTTTPPAKGPTIAERIVVFLTQRGPATPDEIAKALGYDNYRAINSVLSRGTSGAVIVGSRGTGRRRVKLWAMPS